VHTLHSFCCYLLLCICIVHHVCVSFRKLSLGGFFFGLCLSWEKTQMHYIGFRVHNMMFFCHF
jgi:hypothetical protein